MTTKRQKLWYILEGLRMHENEPEPYTTLGVSTPAFKDIEGNTYNSLYALKYGKPFYSKEYATGNQQNVYSSQQDTQTTAMGNALIYKGLLNTYTSFDNETHAYPSSDILSNWSKNDYLINQIGESSDATSLVISYSNDEDYPFDQICNRHYHVTVTNNTNANILVNSIKITKDVYVYIEDDPNLESIYDSHTLTKNYKSAFEKIEVLYATVYLDEPVTLIPSETRTIVYTISPDKTDHSDFVKTSYWNACEVARMANIAQADGAEMITWMNSGQDQFFYNENFPCPALKINYGPKNNPYLGIIGGIRPSKLAIQGFMDTYHFYDVGACPLGLGLATAKDQAWSVSDLDDATYEFMLDSLTSFDSKVKFHPVMINNFDQYVSFANNDYASLSTSGTINTSEVTQTSEFQLSNDIFRRVYTIKIKNSTRNAYTISGLRISKSVNYYMDRGGNGIIVGGDMVPGYKMFGASFTYGYYRFVSPIVIPSADFRILTIIVTPEGLEVQNNA